MLVKRTQSSHLANPKMYKGEGEYIMYPGGLYEGRREIFDIIIYPTKCWGL
jgi:hypothetical protein